LCGENPMGGRSHAQPGKAALETTITQCQFQMFQGLQTFRTIFCVNMLLLDFLFDFRNM
jgi:hypothetical protein